MNIDKDIERCKELIKTEHSNWIVMSNQDAISNVLIDRETWKKIAEKLAEEGNFRIYEDKYCDSNIFSCNVKSPKKTCKQCIIDWAKREVENE